MALHFNAITNDYKNADALAWILHDGMDKCDRVFISKDRHYFHLQTPVLDVLSGEEIGSIAYTVKRDDEEEALELLDLDFLLYTDEYTELEFTDRLGGPEDLNWHYEAVAFPQRQHLEVETVNRYTVTDKMDGSKRKVRASVFPFGMNVFKDMDAFNSWAGIGNEQEVADTGIKLRGYSETFAMPGGVIDDNEDNSFSFLIGRVKDLRDVRISFGDVSWDFVLAHIHCALGTVPAAMGREVFDLSGLAPNTIVAMNADVKADLSKPDDFTYYGRRRDR